MKRREMVRKGEWETGRDVAASTHPPINPSPRLRISPSPRRSVFVAFLLAAALLLPTVGALAQKGKNQSHPRSVPVETFTEEERLTVEDAIGVVCSERARDDRGSVPIDDMQKRPSLPLQAPEVVRGLARARQLLPVAKDLVIASVRKLSVNYKINRDPHHNARISRAIARVQAVTRIKPDIDARDNASVFLKSPDTITFGTIFLASLRSDEGMISVLAHELVHIGDGETDTLWPLFHAVGVRASNLTGLRIREQRAEELTCDLAGELSVQAFITNSPNYDPLPRRLARSVEHNCVDQDDSDEEHLSPRNTLRALLTIDATLRRGIVFGK